MLTDKKQFDEADAEWSTRAEREFRTWLRGHGYEYTPFPNGRFGFDGVAQNNFEKFVVEIERRRKTPKAWNSGDFPWPTVTVPQRREKSVTEETLLFICRSDNRAAVVVFPKSLTTDRIDRKDTRVTRGEPFFYVPKAETLQINLLDVSGPSIAEMNAARVREAARSLNRAYGLACLGSEPPYGMTMEEWKELGDGLEEPLQLTGCSHINRASYRSEADWHGRPGYLTIICGECGGFVGHNPPGINWQ